MRRLLVVAMLGVLAFPWCVRAESRQAIRHLKDRSVSVLDWGLFRLEELLQFEVLDGLEEKEWIGECEGWVRYRWDSNEITISVTAFGDTAHAAVNEKEARRRCREISNAVREYIGVNLKTKRPNANAGIGGVYSGTIMSRFFLTPAYVPYPRSEPGFAELDHITHVQVWVRVKGRHNSLECRCPLLGKLMFSE